MGRSDLVVRKASYGLPFFVFKFCKECGVAKGCNDPAEFAHLGMRTKSWTTLE